MPGEGLVRAKEGRAREVGFGSNSKSRKAGVQDTESGGPPEGPSGESPEHHNGGLGIRILTGRNWPVVEPHTLCCRQAVEGLG